jgi:hypothetical protein
MWLIFWPVRESIRENGRFARGQALKQCQRPGQNLTKKQMEPTAKGLFWIEGELHENGITFLDIDI